MITVTAFGAEHDGVSLKSPQTPVGYPYEANTTSPSIFRGFALIVIILPDCDIAQTKSAQVRGVGKLEGIMDGIPVGSPVGTPVGIDVG